MVTAALTLGGWAAAGLAGGTVLGVRRAATRRREAIVRACHELRGPLAAARLGLHLPPGRDALPAARLRAIDAELGRAALAVEDLLAARRGRLRLAELERVDIDGVLADSIEAWQASAAAAGVRLALASPAGAGGAVWGNRARLSQALGNLIANAIEHGDGPVLVRARPRDGRVRVSVEDGGPGLPAPVGALCRSAGRRGAVGAVGATGPAGAPGRGRGRGLSITAEIAAAHGGRLAAAPALRGARLVLELPLASAGGCSAG